MINNWSQFLINIDFRIIFLKIQSKSWQYEKLFLHADMSFMPYQYTKEKVKNRRTDHDAVIWVPIFGQT